jgi:hypothetical protein
LSESGIVFSLGCIPCLLRGNESLRVRALLPEAVGLQFDIGSREFLLGGVCQRA